MFRVCCVSLVLLASAAYGSPRDAVERQVSSARLEQIKVLRKLTALTQDPKEAAGLSLRLGELYWQEANFQESEAKRKDSPAPLSAHEEKAELLARAAGLRKLAVEQFVNILQRYPNFEHTDEVLFLLGTNLTEGGEDRKALAVFKRLVEKHPKSKYLPQTWLAFGTYYFNNAKGERTELEKALAAYKKAAEEPKSQVYTYALYKQGRCHFLMADYTAAKDMFKRVVLQGQQAAPSALDGEDRKGVRALMVREARADYVRAYARDGDVMQAKEDFSKVAAQPEDRFTMMKQLANLYSEDGKDREAALAFTFLLQEKPLSPESPGFQAKLVECMLRMGDKEGSGKEATELVERTLSNLALLWHEEARKTQSAEMFKSANAISDNYLVLFPKSLKAPEIRKLREERP